MDTAKNFVTVVSVGTAANNNEQKIENPSTTTSDFITVLKIGETTPDSKHISEEVLVYRLPGERLGFGLKFEGGTKANETVKRLFIQSCASESPASRVCSSWGPLIEGDEVLKIDTIPVNSMTRIDCVRCLKDSNVVIKLFVRHTIENPPELRSRSSVEDLPQVVSAEKKRSPPPPPPVPPRKVPRKLLKSKDSEPEPPNNPLPPVRQKITTKSNQSPRSIRSTASTASQDIPRQDKRLSDCSVVPPNAEVYTDLFSHESLLSLSESDDTASTVSTVIDRTTTSSLAGSLPSTPTSTQKQLDLTYINYNFDDDDLAFTHSTTRPNKESTFFQDAPLSYGNEEVRLEAMEERPPVPPRQKLEMLEHDENMNFLSLPRLVDFVPKTNGSTDASIKVMQMFMDNERIDNGHFEQEMMEDDKGFDDVDLYSSKWSLAPQLETIEEEGASDDLSRSPLSTTPPSLKNGEDCDSQSTDSGTDNLKDLSNDNMETLSSDSRQPPDGHEFPDYSEDFSTKLAPYLPQFEKIELPKVGSKDCSSIDVKPTMAPGMHVRSQSLCELSTIQKDHWASLAEHRRKGLSKLKGLVIPEDPADAVEASALESIPEIKSTPAVPLAAPPPLKDVTFLVPVVETVPLALASPPWCGNTNLPKYSPAFKRKSLQVYSTTPKADKTRLKLEDTNGKIENLFDAPKSLESINSPTRSDCSFDYVTPKPRIFKDDKSKDTAVLQKDLDESDNDSAVSSSQSSYISRTSPPPSPERSCDLLEYESNEECKRLLKPSSIEAINRKNILASAKCSSGKDLKVGSPVINRKLQEDVTDFISDKEEVKADILQKVNKAFVEVDSIVEEIASDKPVKEVNGIKSYKPDAGYCKAITPSAAAEDNVVPKVVRKITEPRQSALQVRPKSSLAKNNKSLSVNDLRKSFEGLGTKSQIPVPAKASPIKPVPTQRNFKSPDTAVPAVKEVKKEVVINKVRNPIPKPSLSQLDIKKSSSIDGTNSTKTVKLHPEITGGSIGITLAGGVDYEVKDITIHRIRYGSVAYQDGTLTKGDRIVSINGIPTKNLTHFEAAELLKEPVKQFSLVVEDSKKETEPSSPRRHSSTLKKERSSSTDKKGTKSATHVVTLEKDLAGLGFSIEGGKDSLQGDVPLIVKKIFQGGAAEKDGQLKVKDEILAINDVDFSNLTRIQAWTQMKKIPDGKVTLYIVR